MGTRSDKEKRRGLRTKRYLVPTVLVIATAISLSLAGIVLTQQQEAQGQQSLAMIANSLEPVYPQVAVAKEKISSLEGAALTELAKATESDTVLKDAEGTSKSLVKAGQAELTLLRGANAGGQDIIAATLTNTGTSDIYVASLLITGAAMNGISPLSAYAIDDDYSPEVWVNIQKPAVTEPMLLNPGESVTAHITGKWNIAGLGDEPITTFSAGAGYTYDPTVTEYKEGNNWSISISDVVLP